jgi:hypothetical protein
MATGFGASNESNQAFVLIAVSLETTEDDKGVKSSNKATIGKEQKNVKLRKEEEKM